MLQRCRTHKKGFITRTTDKRAWRYSAAMIAEWFVESVLPDLEPRRRHARRLGLQWFELSKSVETYARMLRFSAPKDDG